MNTYESINQSRATLHTLDFLNVSAAPLAALLLPLHPAIVQRTYDPAYSPDDSPAFSLNWFGPLAAVLPKVEDCIIEIPEGASLRRDAFYDGSVNDGTSEQDNREDISWMLGLGSSQFDTSHITETDFGITDFSFEGFSTDFMPSLDFAPTTLTTQVFAAIAPAGPVHPA